jgi:hypothetical protein
MWKEKLLKSSFEDLDPGSGMERNPGPISESLETIFWVKNT